MNKIGLKYYLEAIPLSKVRPYIKGNKDKYVDRLKDWFDNKWRIYLPIDNSLNVSKDIESEIEKEIKNALSNTQYELKDFEKGLVFDTKNKREVKLGKVLNRIKPELLQKFNNAESRQSKKIKNVMVIISRHPYDILGQSYNRSWTSCKELDKGMYREYLKDEIFLLIVAYLVYENDKNIKKPIARVLATPYFDSTYKTYYKINNTIYGMAGKWEEAFVDTFQKWLNERQKDIVGSFKINPFVYSDQMPQELKVIDQSKIPQWIKDSKNMPRSFSYVGENKEIFKWEDGTWKDGTWEKGVWGDGFWYNGTWKNGQWLNGIWDNGTWEDGTWDKGIWHNGVWKNGLWHVGSWTTGIWERGTWQKGNWFDGHWQKGHWKGGIWYDGTWEKGYWHDGSWGKGTWKNGTWVNGTWNEGTWENGIWKKGIWERGTWKDGTWQNGIWENGMWDSGIWKDGQWLNGHWFDGLWEDGIWENGIWKKGTWKNGRWENGTWKNGTWEKGTWAEGKIFSHVFDKMITSFINPKRFRILENKIEEQGGTLKDFVKKLTEMGPKWD